VIRAYSPLKIFFPSQRAGKKEEGKTGTPLMPPCTQAMTNPLACLVQKGKPLKERGQGISVGYLTRSAGRVLQRMTRQAESRKRL